MNTPLLFHVGQLVTPVGNPISWERQPGAENMPAPQQGKVYEVSAVVQAFWGAWFLKLVEMPAICNYRQDCFSPVEGASNEAIAELVAESFTPVLA